jgi:hypothetical protein
MWLKVESLKPSREVIVCSILTLLGMAVQFTAMRMPPAGYHAAVIAIAQPGANRYHSAARALDSPSNIVRGQETGGRRLATVIAQYPEWMRDESHSLVVTNPPGPLVVFWSLNNVLHDPVAIGRITRGLEDHLTHGVRLEDSPYARQIFREVYPSQLFGAWLAVLLLPAFASLVAIPAYLLARSVYGRREAVLAATFSVTVPSLLLFSPGMDQCYPVLAATAAWLAHGAGRRHSLLMAGLCGLTLSVGFFFSLAFAVAALAAGLLALVGFVQSETKGSPRAVVGLAIAAVAGFLLPVLVLRVTVGYRSFAVWQVCLEANAEFNAASQRGYWTWLMLNPVEFAAFLGVPLACLLAWRAFGKDSLPALAVVGLLVLVDVLGLNRGEVARLWLFLMPVCVAVGVAEIERAAPYRRIVFIALFALQAVQAVVFRAALQVLNIV